MKRAFVFSLAIFVCAMQSTKLFADDSIVPIPPRRPAVLQASQAYVEELRARAMGQPYNTPPAEAEPLMTPLPDDPDHYKDTQLDAIMPEADIISEMAAPSPPVSAEVLEVEISTALENPPTRAEILHAIDPKEVISTDTEAEINQPIEEKPVKTAALKILPDLFLPQQETKAEIVKIDIPKEIKKEVNQEVNKSKSVETIAPVPKQASIVPIPKTKPNNRTIVAKIEPAAGEANNNDTEYSENNKQSEQLVSFYLEPSQLKLDENIMSFLQNHALKIMREDRDIQIEIRSYATVINTEKHSDVRISLARALEVRSFLIENKIDPGRLKLKPMGGEAGTEPDDRIDLLFVKDT